MGANLKEMEPPAILAVLFVTVVGAKFLGCWIATRKTPELRSDRISIAIATLPQGEMGMLVAAYYFHAGWWIPPNQHCIIMVVLLTMLNYIMKVVQIN